MASTYAAVFDRLPHVRKPFDDPGHADRVRAKRTEIENDPKFKRHASWLANEYAIARYEKEKIQAELSKVQVKIDALAQLMEDQFEVEATTSITLVTDDKVRLEPGIHPKIVEPEKFRLWCLADPDLSKKMMLHSSTTESLVRKLLLAGEPEPPGVEAYVWNKVVFTSGG